MVGMKSGSQQEAIPAPTTVHFLDTPELSASMMVDNSAESSWPSEGFHKVNRRQVAFCKKGVGWHFKARALWKRFVESWRGD